MSQKIYKKPNNLYEQEKDGYDDCGKRMESGSKVSL